MTSIALIAAVTGVLSESAQALTFPVNVTERFCGSGGQTIELLPPGNRIPAGATSMQINGTVSIRAIAQYENLDDDPGFIDVNITLLPEASILLPQPSTGEVSLSGEARTSPPLVLASNSTTATLDVTATAAPFDGAIDFAGTSGLTLDNTTPMSLGVNLGSQVMADWVRAAGLKLKFKCPGSPNSNYSMNGQAFYMPDKKISASFLVTVQ